MIKSTKQQIKDIKLEYERKIEEWRDRNMKLNIENTRLKKSLELR